MSEDTTRRFAGGEGAHPGSGTAHDLGRIAHFTLKGLIGSGGQGEVYLATDDRLHRRVALKLLSRTLVHLESGMRSRIIARFRREAEVASRLDHPGICSVYEFGEDQGVPWIAMQFIEGESLANRIKVSQEQTVLESSVGTLRMEWGEETDSDADAPADEPAKREAVLPSAPKRGEVARIVTFVEEAARALHAAHEAGLVHRDVKPGNIMIGPSDRAVILDFGLAFDEQAEGATLTLSGDLLGTPAYMSPEQLAAHRTRIDRRSDVYSLGVTLYECLCLRRPFEAPTRERLYRKITSEEPDPLRRINPVVSRDLATICQRAMEKNPDRRYQSAGDFAEDLRRHLAREPIRARPVGPVTRLVRWSQRNPVIAALLVSLVAFLSVGLGWTVVKNRELDAKRVEAERNLAEVRRMADVQLLSHAKRDLDHLWPIGSELVQRIVAYRTAYRELLDRLPEHERVLGRLSARLERAGRANPYESWRHEVLTRLVGDLRVLADPSSGALAQLAHRERRSHALVARTLVEARPAWEACIDRVRANSEYAGLELVPQEGLVPLGVDPGSGLEEFLHWGTHEPSHPIPARDAGGNLDRMDDRTGIVLVLIPGGTFTIGATRDPAGTHHDPQARDDAGPPHPVVLDPFFIGKHELTRGQWIRIAGSRDPSFWNPETSRGNVDAKEILAHPVENISSLDAEREFSRAGLGLPTEAQWEGAARAGSRDRWFWGPDLHVFPSYANLADEALKRLHPSTDFFVSNRDDGFAATAPVGRFLPNRWGLHDVLGNVAEWCRDQMSLYAIGHREGDGLLPDIGSINRVFRGGSYKSLPIHARIATRPWTPETDIADSLGCRATRRVSR